MREALLKLKTVLIVSSALILINLLVLVFLTLPQMNVTQVRQDRVTEAEEKVKTKEQNLALTQTMLEQLSSENNELEHFYSELLGTRTEKLTSIIAERNTIGNRYGALPLQVSYAFDEIEGQPLERMQMQFSLNGNYNNLRRFINALECSDSFFIIEDVSLNGAENVDALKMQIKVSTYFHRELTAKELERENEH